jgi:hypothetical protein
MRNAILGTAAVALAASGIVAVGISSPASATCIATPEYAAYSPSDSSKFNASVNCNGVLAGKNGAAAEVRGWYNDGIWRQSSYQWVLIGSSGKKVVGQTVDGRLLRVEGRISSYYVAASY